MIYNYQMSNRFFAQIADGMDELGVEELTGLGAQDVKPTFRGCIFPLTMRHSTASITLPGS